MVWQWVIRAGFKYQVLGQQEFLEYDNLLNTTAEIDVNGNRQEKEYDAFGRLTRVIKPGDDYTQELYYMNFGNATSQYVEQRFRDDSSDGYKYERIFFDGLDRIYREQKEGGIDAGSGTTLDIITDVEYFDGDTKDANGREKSDQRIKRQSKPYILNQQSPSFATNEYDSFSRLVKQTFPDGSFKTLSYTTSGSKSVVIINDQNNNIHRQIIDARDRIIRREDPENALVAVDFSQALKETSSDFEGKQTIMNFDSLNRNISMQEPNSGVWLFEHDAGDNITKQTSPSGVVLNFQYDALNRLQIKDYANANETDVVYTYDENTVTNGIGKMTKVTDATGQTLFAYDGRGNVTNVIKTINGTNFAFEATYTSSDKLKTLKYPDGSIAKNHYADSGNLRQVRLLAAGQFFGAPVASYEGPTLDNKILRKMGNGTIDEVGFDLQRQVPTTVITKNKAGSVIRSLSYTYDSIGNTKTVADSLQQGGDKTQVFSYDGLNRLTSSAGVYGQRSYAYSADGNLTKKGSKDFTYSSAAHPQAVTGDNQGNSYAYSTDGNQVNRKGRDYIYDSENRLLEIKENGVTKITYAYDYAGLRASKVREDGAKTYYINGLFNYGSIYEVVEKPGRLSHHTKYFYGIQSDRLAQITRTNVTLAAMQINLYQNYGSYYAITSFVGFNLKYYHKISAWLLQKENWYKPILYAFAFFVLLYLILFFYNYFFHHAELSLLDKRPVFYYLQPILMISLLWLFNCSTSTPVVVDDPAPWGDLPVVVPNGTPDVSTTGNDTSLHGFPIEGAYFYHPNHIGSTQLVTDASGKLVTELNYTPYGETDKASSSGPDMVRYKYTGQEEDPEDGLYNYNNRMYDPETASFTTVDTEVAGDGEDSQGFNRYMYVGGNPVKFVDPRGNGIFDRGGALATTPPWHNYTGPNNKDPSFQLEPVTALDAIAKEHDRAGVAPFKKGTASWEVRQQQIKGDLVFIKDYIKKFILAAPMGFTENLTKRVSNWLSKFENEDFNKTEQALLFVPYLLLGILDAMWQTVVDTIVGQLGVVLFVLNIAFNLAASVASAFREAGLSTKEAQTATGVSIGAVLCGPACAIIGAFAGLF